LAERFGSVLEADCIALAAFTTSDIGSDDACETLDVPNPAFKHFRNRCTWPPG
jgi:hypothetical protein